MLYGGRYAAADVADTLLDVARGSSYSDVARRARSVRAAPGSPVEDDSGPFDGRLVATWVDRFAPAIVETHAETTWPQTVVLDSTEFTWTNPRTGDRVQLFTVLAAWGYPVGRKRGRLWALQAFPTDTAHARTELLKSLPGEPEPVIYHSDKAVAASAPLVWPNAEVYLREHHLYLNARARLRDDGQHGLGNPYRGLLADAGQSYTGWSAFRNAVLDAPGLAETRTWVTHWDDQMSHQTARRPNLPAHRSTGALDPQLAKVRHVLQARAWTYRNLERMNALLGMVRPSINLQDRPSDWAKVILAHAADRPTLTTFNEPAQYLPNEQRVYSLRMHPVQAR